MKNFKLMTKLIGGFMIVAMITLAVGGTGWYSISSLTKSVNELGNVRMPSVMYLLEAQTNSNAIGAVNIKLLNPALPLEERRALYDEVAQLRKQYGGLLKAYIALPQSEEEKVIWDRLKAAIADWKVENNKFFEMSRQLDSSGITNPDRFLQNAEHYNDEVHSVFGNISAMLLSDVPYSKSLDVKDSDTYKWASGSRSANSEVAAVQSELNDRLVVFYEKSEKVRSTYKSGLHAEAKRLFTSELLPVATDVEKNIKELVAIGLEVDGLHEEMNALALGKATQMQGVANDVFQELVDTNKRIAESAKDAAIAQGENGSTITIIGMVAGTVIGLVLGLIIATGIIGPVRKAVELAVALSKGDLNSSIDVHQKDEIGQLAQALQNMTNKLRGVVSSVKTGAENVSTGSTELASSSGSLSQGATEQAASIEEVSSSMEEMSANIRQNAENAKETEHMAVKAAEDTEEGGNAVTQTVEAMKEIAEKISIVEEIARQTNLLALNAAIEAARAGEHGKGFAVVAAEVRKLAERSGAAAAEISELSSSSVEVAEQAGTMLTNIVPDIKRTAELVQEIAAASNEQNEGAEQINRAIQQLDQVVQQNASASEEMASTSEELSSQAQVLQSSMNFFKLDQRAALSGAAPVTRSVSEVQPALDQRRPQPQRSAPAQRFAAPPKSNARDDGFSLDMAGDDEDSDFERF